MSNARRRRQNVEYARTLLLHLEHGAAVSAGPIASPPSPPPPGSMHKDLEAKRTLVRALGQRLAELDHHSGSSSSSSASASDVDDTADVAGVSYAPGARAESGLDAGDGETRATADNAELRSAAHELSTTLLRERRRRGSGAGSEDTDGRRADASTGTDLFAGRSNRPAGTSADDAAEARAADKGEQDALTTSLVALASQLKAQSQHFSATLATDEAVLTRATAGLDASGQGMEAAERKMGMLRRMTEGKGWWARLRLYALIGPLWVAAFLVVFVGPKIRF